MSSQLGRLPLESITVLDLSRVLSGPYCSRMLGDMGAKVWKGEPPTGDDSRGLAPPHIKQVLHKKMLTEIPPPTIGSHRMIGFLIRLNQNPGKIRLPAPLQGGTAGRFCRNWAIPKGRSIP